jgi:glycosyltransferase involved in cell wall biosynthesis
MPALYRTADVIISIPHSDAAPVSVLEAMACGTPCVVCDLPSLREWISDGENGYLVDQTNVSAVAATVVRALDEREGLNAVRQRARSAVVERASQRAQMDRMAAHYVRLAAPAGAPAGQNRAG